MSQDGNPEHKSGFFKRVTARLRSYTALSPGVSGMQTLPGLLSAYWRGDKKGEAWALSAATLGMTVALGWNSVPLAESLAGIVNALASMRDPHNLNPNLYLGKSVLEASGYMASATGLMWARHLASANLHRKWRGWLSERFTGSVIDDKNTHLKLLHWKKKRLPEDALAAQTDEKAWGEKIVTVLPNSIKDMSGAVIGLTMGLVGIGSTFTFVGKRLLETSTPVHGMEFLGGYSSLSLALATSALYSVPGTYLAFKLGKWLEKNNRNVLIAENSYRGHWHDLSANGFNMAAAKNEPVMKAAGGKIFGETDKAWRKQIMANAAFMAFGSLYNQFSSSVVSYIPYFLAYQQHIIGFKDFLTGASLTGAFNQSCSWLINVMPDIANMKANAKLVMELAQAVEDVKDADTYCKETGISNFEYAEQDRRRGLTVENLKLMLPGMEEKTILKASRLTFSPGQKTYVQGDSGCGKTTLFNAIAGMPGYGEGKISYPKGQEIAYASQSVYLPPVSLKQLVTMPDNADMHHDMNVVSVLEKVGLGELAGHIHDEYRDGKLWGEANTLSGGQKQKLVLAGILLKKPSILLLDEPTSALDPQSKEEFHELLDEHCSDMTIISILHDDVPPLKLDGTPFYDSVLRIGNGYASIRRLPKKEPSSRFIGPRSREQVEGGQPYPSLVWSNSN